MIEAIPIIGELIGGVRDHFKGKRELKKIKQQANVDLEKARVQAQIERISAGDTNAAELDRISISNRGWKDEYLLLIVTVPLIMSFIPEFVPYVTAGFGALQNVPEWYMWVLLGVFIDTFGFRRMLRVAVEKYLKNKFG